MQWWCAAQGIPWDWSWRPYPGVWLFIACLCLAYRAFTRGAAPSRVEVVRFAGGALILWIALDWPVGALGSGYLASVHMVQFLLIALLAPPLLIAGLPRAALERVRGGAIISLLGFLARPLIALLFFNAIVITTHWPEVVDGLMASQAGSLVLDMAWLGGGLIFWWPVVSPVPHRPRFPLGVRIGYLIASTVLMTLPYVFLTFAELPFYATYELAPPVGTLSAGEDQRLAGLIMRIGGGTILWTAAGVIFWFWYRSENDAVG
ncbi:MAG: cytochrome c oxidase assembly protein [Gemmatimonadetes bacterium]|nr:cytochrome c oxidase assembly protein [Candidatus Palauibacter australiensis]